jgi:4-amino-4-deoxy-L-arabinose transferase-like glycosyltransferase
MVLAAATTVFYLLTLQGYGVFRDELYYAACAQRLDWGYVDHPPLVALVAWVMTHLLGTTVFALRVVSAVCAGALVLLSAAIARELGGGRFAQILAGLAVATSPLYLALFSVYSMNAIDLVAWAALAWVAVRIINTDNSRLWLLFGLVAGIGLQNKLSVLFFVFGLAAGLVAARQWRRLRDPWLWAGVGVAALLFAPQIAWQMANGWPTAEFVRNATEHKNISLSAVEFLSQQILNMNPVALPLWVTGLIALLAWRDFKPYRALGWAYPAVLALMLTQAAKPYYLGPIYPMLFAAGAAVLERFSQERRRWLRPASLGLVLAAGAALAPLAKPLLPVDAYVRFAAALGVKPGTDEKKTLGRLPQFFADMHGWRELAEAVSRVHRALPAEEQGRACVFGQNYGEAGAIDFYRKQLGLPPAVSGHNSYWIWGPGECDGQVLIVIGGRREELGKSFERVEAGGRFDCRDCMPYEQGQTIWVGRGLRSPLSEVWPTVKNFN